MHCLRVRDHAVPEEVSYRDALPDGAARVADGNPRPYVPAPICADLLVWAAAVRGDAAGGVVSCSVCFHE